uniref:Uncharacterized protein n=1 Tax=Heterosigma akashiwo TaxID=2829 RepID=A0A7S3XX72_HETAK|mmetsp:Transcript_33777/g.55135  ORF Transcript_33777/g.55135 Transcript_33777/m.55135 type:complete len:338 (-) Transcript_33777:240-1253(-)
MEVDEAGHTLNVLPFVFSKFEGLISKHSRITKYCDEDCGCGYIQGHYQVASLKDSISPRILHVSAVQFASTVHFYGYLEENMKEENDSGSKHEIQTYSFPVRSAAELMYRAEEGNLHKTQKAFVSEFLSKLLPDCYMPEGPSLTFLSFLDNILEYHASPSICAFIASTGKPFKKHVDTNAKLWQRLFKKEFNGQSLAHPSRRRFMEACRRRGQLRRQAREQRTRYCLEMALHWNQPRPGLQRVWVPRVLNPRVPGVWVPPGIFGPSFGSGVEDLLLSPRTRAQVVLGVDQEGMGEGPPLPSAFGFGGVRLPEANRGFGDGEAFGPLAGWYHGHHQML